ncbi:MAG: regulatory iron-sulfur-containing complex subunit RicT [Chloroflexota bacterium]
MLATIEIPAIIGVRFHKVGKLYHFDASAFPEVKMGDRVIVETQRGTQMGEVAKFVAQPDPGGHRPIERLATPRDLLMAQQWQVKETEAMINCRERAAQLQLRVKIVRAEYNYDGSRLTFFFSSDNDDKAETKSLQSDMQKMHPATHVELRQIGPRDVAKLLGGAGACGLEQRCCSTFLTEFSPISIKMAKEQGISLNPDEIAGMCGRLRCCLVYEYEQYMEARKHLPKRGKRIGTPKGQGKVLDLNPLKETAIVLVDEIRYEFKKDELIPLDELDALAAKSNKPCDRHEGGGCDCGKSRKK